jgi:hypothetical protein
MLNLRNRDNGNGSTRQQEINDVNDTFLRANKRVFEREKEWINIFQDSIKPDTQLDIDVANSNQKNVEGLINLLEKKIDNIEDIIKNSTDYGSIKHSDKNFDIIIHNSDMIRDYNSLIRSYKNPSISQQTRESIKTNIQNIVRYIDAIVFGFHKILDDVFFKYKSVQTRTLEPMEFKNDVQIQALPNNIKLSYLATYNISKSYLKRVLSSISLYIFIQKSLFRNNFNLVTLDDINNEFSDMFGKLPVDQRDYAELIMQDDLITSAQKNAVEKRLRLLREDQNLPLSTEQTTAVMRSMFGRPFLDADLSPDELDALENISEIKKEILEKKSKIAETNILQGLPPNLIPQNILPLDTDIGKQKRKQYDEDYTMRIIKKTEEINKLFDDKIRSTGDKCTPKINQLHPTIITGNDPGQIKQIQAKQDVKYIKKICYQLWHFSFIHMYERPPSVVEFQNYEDNTNLKYREITDAIINEKRDNGFRTADNPDGARLFREAIYNDCEAYIFDTVDEARQSEQITIQREIQRIYDEHQEKYKMSGQGKPKYNRFNHRFYAMDYDDTKNDNYSY